LDQHTDALYHFDSHMDDAAMTGTGTRRWWALCAMVLAVLTVSLDVTVLTVARDDGWEASPSRRRQPGMPVSFG
jgi:hypothetical protein